MMDMPMGGTPWLSQPVLLHSSRAFTCKLNTTEQCDYYESYWRYWYIADLVYAYPTVAFFSSVIALFAIAYFVNTLLPPRLARAKPWRQATAFARFLSYRSFRIPALDWNSAPIGVLMLGAVGTIYFFCMTFVPQPYYWPPPSLSWAFSPPLGNRSGWLSIGCMPFVFLTAGKSNFITAVTGVSYEKLQVFHRWISYAFFLTALLHTFPFIINDIYNGVMQSEWNTEVQYWTGVIAILAQAWLTFASFSPIRNWNYEWFKFSHFLAVLVFMVFFFLHCNFTLTSWDFFIVSGVFFSLSWLHRQVRVYFEHGIGKRAQVSLTTNGFIRVSVPTHTTWRAGQHFFVRFLTPIGHAWTIHPFTACTLPERTSTYESKESELVFFIRPRTGFTARLAKIAEKRPNTTVRVLLDGPYGGIDMHKIQDSQRMIVLAGGSGAGWVMPLITSYLRRLELAAAAGFSGALPSMRVILATRDVATREWFERAVNELIASSSLDKAPADLQIEVYHTGSAQNLSKPVSTGQFLQQLDEPEKVAATAIMPYESQSDSDEASNFKSELQQLGSGDEGVGGIPHLDSRPDLPGIVKAEIESSASTGPLAVFVCGPLSMQSDVANAVAKEQLAIARSGDRDVYLHMEHFSWA